MRYVLYHANCYDGFGAAYACWKKFGEDAVYIPCSYGQPFPNLGTEMGHDIYIVDFSYPAATINELLQHHNVFIYDHHKTAKEDLKGLQPAPNLKIVFDMDRSGALITWHELHGTDTPDLIRHISDRDLWTYRLDGTKEIHRALVSYPMDFVLWDSFNIETLIKEGRTCNRIYEQLIENIIEGSFVGKMGHYYVPMVNTSIAWSEVGQELLKKYRTHAFVASFTEFETETMWSLRSIPEFDCSVIAKEFGGGGHKNAAGFRVKRNLYNT